MICEDKFVNLQTAAEKSQIKVWAISVRLSKDSNLSISNFQRKWHLWNEFSDLLTSSVTDQGLDYLSESLKRLNALQSINLGFNW